MGRTYRKRSSKRRCKHGKLRNPYKSKKSGKFRVCKSKRKSKCRKKKCKYGKLKGYTKSKKTGKRRCCKYSKRRRRRKRGMTKKSRSKRARANWKKLGTKAKNLGRAQAGFTDALLF